MLRSRDNRSTRNPVVWGWRACASGGLVVAAVAGVAGEAHATDFSCSYSGGGGSWTSPADWSNCNGAFPDNGGGNTYDATLSNNATVALTTANTAGALTIGSGALQISGGNLETFTGNVSNAGNLSLDLFGGQGGSSLTIGGTLTNSNYVLIGNGGLSANTTVTAAGLNNTGRIDLNGNGTNQASLIVNAAAPSASTGTVNLNGNAVLQYSGGGITSIANGAQINENGATARVALASAPTTNSALAGLASNAGQLFLYNGATLTTKTGLNNSGNVALDYYGGSSGSSLTVGGTLTNSNFVQVGNGGQTINDTLTAAGLNNTGRIDLNGNGTSQASLIVNAAAPSASTGTVNLNGNAVLQYSGGGITSIANGAQINENGATARVALASAPTTNSALAGLASNAGQLFLYNGATLTTKTGLNNSGNVALDYYGGSSGSSLTVGGTLTNSNFVQVGNGGQTINDTLTAAGLNNTGRIDLNGNGTSQASLIVNAAAPSASTGVVNVNGNALLQYTGGGITSIASGGQINENGANARVALASAPTTNSALVGLASNAGQLFLYNGATLTTTTGLNNSGTLVLDYYGGSSGSSLTVGGTLANSNYVQVGNGGQTVNDTLTAAGLNNTGRIDLNGNGTSQASLIVNAAAPSASTGVVNVNGNALLQYTGGGITSIASGGQINENGANARVALASAPTTNSALAGLASNAGQLFLYNGATLTTTTGLNNSGTLVLDYYGGSSGSSLTVGGALTNSNYVQVGNGGQTVSDTLTAAGLNNTGTVSLNGNGTSQASLIVNAAAPSASTGVVNVNGNALLQYSGGGITSIASGAQINENGANARVALASAPTTNSALVGLASNAGQLFLYNGATLATTTGLNNSGSLVLDYYGGSSGSSLTVGGTLTNSNNVQVGNGGQTVNDTLTAAGLDNTGTVTLNGNVANQASLIVNAAAPSVATGTVNLLGDALLQYTGGGITSIGSGAQINENGANARVALASAPTTNSALVGLASNAGQFSLQNGATLTTSTGLSNSNALYLDQYGGEGGSSLNVGGTLANSNYLQIGEVNLSANSTIIAAGLNNTGTISLQGNGTNVATFAVNGAAANSGTANIASSSAITVTSAAYTQTAGQTNVSGTLTAPTIANNGGIIQGTGAIDGAVANAATLAGGFYTNNQTGTLNIHGSLLNTAAGTVQALIQGTGAGQTSVVNVASGPVSLAGGTLNAATSNGYGFALGDTLTVATFAPGILTGVFSALASGAASGDGVSANLGNGLTLDASYNNHAGNIQLQVVATPTTTADAWTGGAGNFSTAGQWTHGVPVSYSDVTIGQTNSGNVTLNQDATINSLAINAGNALQYQAGTPESLTVGQNVTVDGNGSTATLALGTSGDTLSLGGDFANLGSANTSIGAGAQILALGTANNTGEIDLSGGSLSAAGVTNAGLIFGLSGTSTVTPTGGAQLANSGAVQAQGGGTLVIATGISGAGSASALASSTLDLSGATAGNTVGKLQLTGTGAALKLGSQSITVSNDYNNSNFGVGNGFNNHAGVSGTGPILASGNAKLGLSGANVTNGTTSTPTVAIGNVHVAKAGSTSFTVDNTGTTGPSLRGAVQNGGVTTPGLVVAAQNFGPVATGASSAAQTVTYTATKAGSVASDSFKVVSNFDNVSPLTVGVTASAYDFANPTVNTTQPVNVGNFHVGSAPAQAAVSVSNATISNAAFQEGLDASTGAATGAATSNGGSFSLLAAGGTNASAIKVGVNGTTAGVETGMVALNLVSDGASTSHLGTTTLASQNVSVTGTGYNLASSNTIAPISFGVLHTNTGTHTEALTVSNTAPTGAYSEGLDSSFGGYTNKGGLNVTASGSITNLAAGATDASSLVLSLSTATAGMVNGTILVHQASNGTIDGLGNTALADQNPGVSGTVQATVTNLATPQINNAPINVGNVRIGSAAPTQGVSVTNTAPAGGFSESLIGNVTGTTGTGITAAGGFGPPSANPEVAPQGTDARSIQVGIDTASAGAKSGSAVIDFKSDGTAFQGGTVTDLGNTSVAVTGAVYRLASPTLNTPNVTLAARVGDAAPTASVSVSNTSPDQYTEGLNAGFGTAVAGFATSGSVANLAATLTDMASLGIKLNTATSGSFGGTQQVAFASTGVGTDNATDLALAPGNVTVAGHVYQAATASVSPNPVAFGTVHVGDAGLSRSVSVGNTASGALVDTLTGGFGSVSGPFTGSGALTVAAGSSGSLSVGLNTATAGVFNGSANLALTSHDGELTDAAVAAGPVGLTATVNNYAKAGLGQVAGSGVLSAAATVYTLDFGSVAQGSGSLSDNLFAANIASGPADLLSGMFTIASGGGDFGLAGFATGFSDLAAGSHFNGLDVSFDTSATGMFTETLNLQGVGSNDSGYNSAASIDPITLIIDGTVTAGGGGGNPVPEPSGLAVLGVALLGMLGLRRRAG